MRIEIEVNDKYLNNIKNMFPEYDSQEEVLIKLCEFSLIELIELFSGNRRYLSLSHQYIEWLEKIYEALLPDEEITKNRLQNYFNFPPGTSQYMERVLRDKSNTSIHKKSIEKLHVILKDEILKFNANPSIISNLRENIKITYRQEKFICDLIDEYFAQENKTIDYPKITSTPSRKFKIISWHINELKKFFELLERKIG